MKAAISKQNNRLITSISLSTITVPKILLNGIESDLLSAPQRVTSPRRGKARLAKYPINTEQVVFLSEGEYPNGWISKFHLCALIINAVVDKRAEIVTQKIFA